jgi:hypothetical protein
MSLKDELNRYRSSGADRKVAAKEELEILSRELSELKIKAPVERSSWGDDRDCSAVRFSFATPSSDNTDVIIVASTRGLDMVIDTRDYHVSSGSIDDVRKALTPLLARAYVDLTAAEALERVHALLKKDGEGR